MSGPTPRRRSSRPSRNSTTCSGSRADRHGLPAPMA
jgi:hypothetical protein